MTLLTFLTPQPVEIDRETYCLPSLCKPITMTSMISALPSCTFPSFSSLFLPFPVYVLLLLPFFTSSFSPPPILSCFSLQNLTNVTKAQSFREKTPLGCKISLVVEVLEFQSGKKRGAELLNRIKSKNFSEIS